MGAPSLARRVFRFWPWFAAVVVSSLLIALAWRRPRRAPLEARISVLRMLGPREDDAKFARALGPRSFVFPADHGAHPDYRSEWWYWTGNVVTGAGRRFGYQLTIFRTAQTPEPDKARQSAWAVNQTYMAHFALTDVEAGAFHAFERTSRGALGLAGAEASPFRVWVEDWSAEGEGATDGRLRVRLKAADAGVKLDLELEPGKPLVLQGDGGLSRKGTAPGNASYYYSRSRMPTSGELIVDGQRYDVHGDSWMDREWSTSALEPDQVGWDWFSLQLSDGRDLMFFRLRRRDGSTDPMNQGALIDDRAKVVPLTSRDVNLEPLGTFRSPRSGAAYPGGFRLRAPSTGLDLTVRPLVADQELDVTFRYWEGAVMITGTAFAEPVTGHGYLEMTGYGESVPELR